MPNITVEGQPIKDSVKKETLIRELEDAVAKAYSVSAKDIRTVIKEVLPGRDKQILIIDDEVKLVSMLKEFLESRGYSVISAIDGLEGLEKALNEDASLILLDIKMPGMDGFEVLRRLKLHPKTQPTPIIMFTQKRETTDIFEASEGGAVDYIMKPISMEELLETVKKHVS